MSDNDTKSAPKRKLDDEDGTVEPVANETVAVEPVANETVAVEPVANETVAVEREVGMSVPMFKPVVSFRTTDKRFEYLAKPCLARNTSAHDVIMFMMEGFSHSQLLDDSLELEVYFYFFCTAHWIFNMLGMPCEGLRSATFAEGLVRDGYDDLVLDADQEAMCARFNGANLNLMRILDRVRAHLVETHRGAAELKDSRVYFRASNRLATLIFVYAMVRVYMIRRLVKGGASLSMTDGEFLARLDALVDATGDEDSLMAAFKLVCEQPFGLAVRHRVESENVRRFLESTDSDDYVERRKLLNNETVCADVNMREAAEAACATLNRFIHYGALFHEYEQDEVLRTIASEVREDMGELWGF